MGSEQIRVGDGYIAVFHGTMDAYRRHVLAIAEHIDPDYDGKQMISMTREDFGKLEKLLGLKDDREKDQ